MVGLQRKIPLQWMIWGTPILENLHFFASHLRFQPFPATPFAQVWLMVLNVVIACGWRKEARAIRSSFTQVETHQHGVRDLESHRSNTYQTDIMGGNQAAPAWHGMMQESSAGWLSRCFEVSPHYQSAAKQRRRTRHHGTLPTLGMFSAGKFVDDAMWFSFFFLPRYMFAGGLWRIFGEICGVFFRIVCHCSL